MLLLLVCLILFLSISIVLYPIIFSRNSTPYAYGTSGATQALRRQRERIYEEIRILEQEYFLDHLPQSIYLKQREKLREHAAFYLYQESIVVETFENLEGTLNQQLRRSSGMDTSQTENSAGEESQERPE